MRLSSILRLHRAAATPWILVLALGATFASGACSDGEQTGSVPPGPHNTVGVGPDLTSNGQISIDEASLKARVDGSVLRLTIPIRSVSKTHAQGSLNISLLRIGAAGNVVTTTASYSLDPDALASSQAEFTVPNVISRQSDWVRYVVRIDDGTQGGLRVNRSVYAMLSSFELVLQGPATVTKGRKASWRIRVQDPTTRTPVAGQAITAKVMKGSSTIETLQGVTGSFGDATFEFTPSEQGAYSIVASAPDLSARPELTAAVNAQDTGARILLTSDKPIYQPGQLIHMRSLTLSDQGNTPVTGADILFEVFDGKGNKVFKKPGKTDAYGIAAASFQLGGVVNQGDYKLKTSVGGTVSEKSVHVAPYALPKFKADVTTDHPWYLPGQTVQAVVDADYYFGKPVAQADVTVEALTLDIGESVFQKVQGKTDADGRLPVQLTLPSSLVGLPIDHGNAVVIVRATVVDSAGQQVKKEAAISVSQNGLDLVLVPEATTIVPGIDNRLDLFVTDPVGQPAAGLPAQLQVVGGATLQGTTDQFGYASFGWNPGTSCNGSCPVFASVQQNGKTVQEKFTFVAQQGSEHLVVRTDKAVYSLGDEVSVEVRATPSSSHVYVDWLNNGQTVEMRTVPVDNGTASFSTTADLGRLGANRIEAYVVDEGGNIVRSGRTVFVRNDGSLSVTLSTDKPQYVPGEAAKLTFSVKDEKNQPAVAALGVQIVDEAVFGLVDAQPGLLRTYFEIENDFAQPKYEIEGPSGSLESTILDDTANPDPAKAQAAQQKAAAGMAALGDATPTGIYLSSWTAESANLMTTVQEVYASLHADLLPAVKALADQASASLAKKNCKASDYWCDGEPYTQALGKEMCSRWQGWDPWGNAFTCEPAYGTIITLGSGGPDEKMGTTDDGTIGYSPWDLQVPYPGGSGADASADGGYWGASGAAGSSTGVGGSGQGGGGNTAEPRVRKFFPETLYVNPALITDPNGTATVDLAMADSITSWRVSALANTQAGKLGGGLAGVTVFQDFFVDIDFPSSLTWGDEVHFPIAIYNYLTVPQSVTLQLQPGDWYTALGTVTTTVDLAAGQVAGVRFPVRVDKVGLQTLTVKALGTQASDAIARTVRVAPGGKDMPSSVSGTLAAGEVTHSSSFPANAIPGSPRLFLNVFPAYFSQVVQGMDSMLQTPYGCFEQTTSTTWPNVLVSRYMQDTGQITPAIQMKADSYINAGYQRLLTFEHPAGGFSWFGTQDPAPNLSVTAFGLMEFADMSKVATVDEALITRTANWLASQQQGDGSWLGSTTEFFTFGTSTLRNTAFVVWALQHAGYQGNAISKGLAYLKAQGVQSQDVYTLGIMANALQLLAPNDPVTTTVFDALVAAATTQGDKTYWDGSGTQTDFYGAGADATVASTAIAAHALILRGGSAGASTGAMKYLLGTRSEWGTFGSTQATIWTLRTLILAATKGTDAAVGTMQVSLDGAPYSTLDLVASQSDVMSTVELGNAISAGAHDVKLTFVGTGQVSYHLVSGYNLAWSDVPAAPPGQVSIAVSYDKTSLALDELATATVSVTNNTASDLNMVLVTVGVPPGFQVQTDDLAPFVTSGALSNFELTPKQLTLYLTKLGKSSTQTFEYRLLATMPVVASDGGGEAYPYYEPTAKSSLPSTTFTVQ